MDVPEAGEGDGGGEGHDAHFVVAGRVLEVEVASWNTTSGNFIIVVCVVVIMISSIHHIIME